MTMDFAVPLITGCFWAALSPRFDGCCGYAWFQGRWILTSGNRKSDNLRKRPGPGNTQEPQSSLSLPLRGISVPKPEGAGPSTCKRGGARVISRESGLKDRAVLEVCPSRAGPPILALTNITANRDELVRLEGWC
jgi:hypothetical protein